MSGITRPGIEGAVVGWALPLIGAFVAASSEVVSTALGVPGAYVAGAMAGVASTIVVANVMENFGRHGALAGAMEAGLPLSVATGLGLMFALDSPVQPVAQTMLNATALPSPLT